MWALVMLLHQNDRACLRKDLFDEYEERFKKTIADFNILESELSRMKLITAHQGTYSEYWELTMAGMEVASKLHKGITNIQTPQKPFTKI